MNWDAIGAIGEIVGALAVVSSVAYLAVQIRRQTDQSRLAATRDLAHEYAQSMDKVIDDSEFAAIYLQAVREYNELPNEERIRAALYFQRLVRVREQAHLHVTKGHMDPSFFNSMDTTMGEWFRFPGAQQWWRLNHEYFDVDFRSLVEDQIVGARAKGYESTFKDEYEDRASSDSGPSKNGR